MNFFYSYLNRYEPVSTGVTTRYISTNRSHVLSCHSEEYFSGNKEAGKPYKVLEEKYYLTPSNVYLKIVEDEGQYLCLRISSKDYEIL